jgi:uncharacterized protein DUF3179
MNPGHTGMAPPVSHLLIRPLAALLTLLLAPAAVAESKNGFVLDDALVPAEEILEGGPGRDGIRSLDYPDFIAAADANYLKSKDRVLGIELNGIARAYPLRILNYHEIVNDTFGGKALVVTYCPLCNSGIAFDARVGGTRLEFGVSGLLYNSDVLLYDRQSGSLWSQIDKTAISGAMKGTRLVALPLTHTTWRDWLARHPDTEVLTNETGFRRDYGSDPYLGYRRTGSLMFPVAGRNPEYRNKSLVLGLEIDGRFKAYPFGELRKSPELFADQFQGQEFEVRFDKKNDAASIVNANGDELPVLIAYWFAWYAFHPESEIYAAD